MLGASKEALRAARLAGVVHPRRVGRSFRWTDADLAAFRASRRGMCAKSAADALGISRTTLATLRRAGRIKAVPAGGTERIRYLYDVGSLR